MDAKQDKLVSGTNIKTINGTSILGSGDITISGGSDSTVTESTVSGWGFTKNTGTYSKPSGGIPKSDLASAVQTSLGKADTALQSHQDISGKQDKLVSGTNIKTINNTSILGSGNISITGGSGTITGVSANGTSVATSGVANIPAASTSAYGVTKLSSSTSSTSTTLAATASAVKSAYDLANSYKGTVTGVKVNGTTKSPASGTVDIGNVVTSVKVNGNTYSPTSGVVDLGTISGDSSSGGSTTGYEYVEPRFDFEPDGDFIYLDPMQPNKIYVASHREIIGVYINSFESSSQLGDEYHLIFYADNGLVYLTMPTVTWLDGEPSIDEGGIYELSVMRVPTPNGADNYLAIMRKF